MIFSSIQVPPALYQNGWRPKVTYPCYLRVIYYCLKEL